MLVSQIHATSRFAYVGILPATSIADEMTAQPSWHLVAPTSQDIHTVERYAIAGRVAGVRDYLWEIDGVKIYDKWGGDSRLNNSRLNDHT